MAAYVNARVAILDFPTVSELVVGSDGRTHFRGSSVCTSFTDSMIRLKMNLTYVLNPVKGFKPGTPDANGTYSGLIGMIQANKADLSFVPVPQAVSFVIPGKSSSVIFGSYNLIATDDCAQEAVPTTAFDCVRIFSVNVYLVTLMTALLVLVSLVPKRIIPSIWMICGLVFEQNYGKAIGFRKAQLLLILLFLSLRSLFDSRYSTEATIRNPPKPVNTLADLHQSKRLPLWTVNDVNYYAFKHGVTKMHAKIWSLRTNRSIINDEIDASLLGSKHFALLCGKYNLVPAKKLLCSIPEWKSNVRTGKKHLHISEPFGSVLWSFLYSKSVKQNLEERINRLSQAYMENHLHGHTLEALIDDYLPPSDNGCVNSITNPLKEDKPPAKVNFRFLGLKFFFAVLLILLLIGTIEIFALRK